MLDGYFTDRLVHTRELTAADLIEEASYTNYDVLHLNVLNRKSLEGVGSSTRASSRR
ncbi:MAG: hypothetical protein ACLTMP_08890 [Eggerthella lenta]